MLELSVKRGTDGGRDVCLKREGSSDDMYTDMLIAIASIITNDLGEDDLKDPAAVADYMNEVARDVVKVIAEVPHDIVDAQTITIDPAQANACDMCNRCINSANRRICAIADTCNYEPVPAESEEE